MKSMSKAFLILVATALVGTGFSTRAEAAVITLANVIATATTVDADVLVSGLGEATGGYAVQITYNPVDFSGATYDDDPTNKLGDGVANVNLDGSGGFGFPGAGTFDLDVLAGYLTLAELNLAQGPFPASFVLAHVTFNRTSDTAGTGLALGKMALSNWDGTATIPLNGTVPEPASMLLVGTGLATLVARRRKQNKA